LSQPLSRHQPSHRDYRSQPLSRISQPFRWILLLPRYLCRYLRRGLGLSRYLDPALRATDKHGSNREAFSIFSEFDDAPPLPTAAARSRNGGVFHHPGRDGAERREVLFPDDPTVAQSAAVLLKEQARRRAVNFGPPLDNADRD
jgi:hypothetical protein